MHLLERFLHVEDTFGDFGLTVGGGSGPEALSIVKEEGPFDLFVIDVIMPKMRGHELAGQLRRLHPDAKVLYLTAYVDLLLRDRMENWPPPSPLWFFPPGKAPARRPLLHRDGAEEGLRIGFPYFCSAAREGSPGSGGPPESTVGSFPCPFFGLWVFSPALVPGCVVRGDRVA